MGEDLRGILEYKVYSNEVNAQAEMPLAKVVEILIDSASRHAESRGFGYQDLKKKNQAWVLARVALEMSRYPKVDEIVKVETWVEGINRVFSSRNFKLTDVNGETLGYARTIWSVIDFSTRQSVDLTTYKGIAEFKYDYPCPIDVPSRSGKIEDVAPETYKIRISELDVNRNLTSKRYRESMSDRYTLADFDKKRISRFEIKYLNEIIYDDEISILKQELSEAEEV